MAYSANNIAQIQPLARTELVAQAAEVRAQYSSGNPKSYANFEKTKASLPGANTRSVLHYSPFPVTIIRAEGAQGEKGTEAMPGHDAVSEDTTPILEMMDCFVWLETVLMESYDTGFDITEVTVFEIPGRFRDYALAKEEFRRSVSNLFPELEAAGLPAVN